MIAGIIGEVSTQTECMPFAKRQTESETIRKVVKLDKRRGYQLVNIAGHSLSHILNGEKDGSVVLCDIQLDMLAVRELGSIVKQLADGPHEIEAIGQNPNSVGQFGL
jgi:hypothetical protein